MKTAKVKGEVERTIDSLEPCRVFGQKLHLHASFAGFLPRKFDRAWSEIHAGYFPACIGKGDGICARAAANVYGAARFVSLDKFK